jgi:hypothetical protein
MNQGGDDGKRQQLAGQGKEEAEEGCSTEARPREVFTAAQEALTSAGHSGYNNRVGVE